MHTEIDELEASIAQLMLTKVPEETSALKILHPEMDEFEATIAELTEDIKKYEAHNADEVTTEDVCRRVRSC